MKKAVLTPALLLASATVSARSAPPPAPTTTFIHTGQLLDRAPLMQVHRTR